MLLSVQVKAEGEALPVLGQVWMGLPATVSMDTQATKAKDHGLPGSACRGGVDAVAGVPTHIAQVGAGGADEVLVGFIYITHQAGNDGLDGRPKR